MEAADDGVYRVGQSGELTMHRDGEQLVLEGVRPADGWDHRVDDNDDDDEVEVTFSGDGREIEFEAEIDDGALEIEVCEDR